MRTYVQDTFEIIESDDGRARFRLFTLPDEGVSPETVAGYARRRADLVSAIEKRETHTPKWRPLKPRAPKTRLPKSPDAPGFVADAFAPGDWIEWLEGEMRVVGQVWSNGPQAGSYWVTTDRSAVTGRVFRMTRSKVPGSGTGKSARYVYSVDGSQVRSLGAAGADVDMSHLPDFLGEKLPVPESYADHSPRRGMQPYDPTAVHMGEVEVTPDRTWFPLVVDGVRMDADAVDGRWRLSVPGAGRDPLAVAPRPVDKAMVSTEARAMLRGLRHRAREVHYSGGSKYVVREVPWEEAEAVGRVCDACQKPGERPTGHRRLFTYREGSSRVLCAPHLARALSYRTADGWYSEVTTAAVEAIGDAQAVMATRNSLAARALVAKITGNLDAPEVAEHRAQESQTDASVEACASAAEHEAEGAERAARSAESRGALDADGAWADARAAECRAQGADACARQIPATREEYRTRARAAVDRAHAAADRAYRAADDRQAAVDAEQQGLTAAQDAAESAKAALFAAEQAERWAQGCPRIGDYPARLADWVRDARKAAEEAARAAEQAQKAAASRTAEQRPWGVAEWHTVADACADDARDAAKTARQAVNLAAKDRGQADYEAQEAARRCATRQKGTDTETQTTAEPGPDSPEQAEASGEGAPAPAGHSLPRTPDSRTVNVSGARPAGNPQDGGAAPAGGAAPVGEGPSSEALDACASNAGVVGDPGTVDTWDTEGGAVPGVETPTPAPAPATAADTEEADEAAALAAAAGHPAFTECQAAADLLTRYAQEHDDDQAHEWAWGAVERVTACAWAIADEDEEQAADYAREARGERAAMTLGLLDEAGPMTAERLAALDADTLDLLRWYAGPWPVRWLWPPETDEAGRALRPRVVNLFHGPGGWSVGIRDILGADVDMIGVDLDPGAVATAHAAGFDVIHADVTDLDPECPALQWVSGVIISPPCQPYSPAGLRRGRYVSAIDLIVSVIHGIGAGAGFLPWDGSPTGYAPRSGETWEEIRAPLAALDDPRAGLMAEVAVWPLAMLSRGGSVDWVAVEQSSALPEQIEHALFGEFVHAGWNTVEAETLDAADYGAASRRRRRFMAAYRRTSPFIDVRPAAALPTVTFAQCVGWKPGRLVNTRGQRRINPETGRPKGGGTFSADQPSICVTATAYAWKDAESGRRIGQADIGRLVGFRGDYPWRHVGRGQGIRTRAQQAADAVCPMVAAAVIGRTLGREWEGRTRAYVWKLYGLGTTGTTVTAAPAPAVVATVPPQGGAPAPAPARAAVFPADAAAAPASPRVRPAVTAVLPAEPVLPHQAHAEGAASAPAGEGPPSEVLDAPALKRSGTRLYAAPLGRLGPLPAGASPTRPVMADSSTTVTEGGRAMTETAERYERDRRVLLEHPVPGFEAGVTPAAALVALARLGDELAELLAAAYPERPSAYVMESHHRRRAGLLTHLSAAYPEYEPAARSAVEHWQRAMSHEVAEVAETVRHARGTGHP
ncbi:DNA cytosine methyltransferase [Streptomyces albus]|uniref:DNA cytosine methyltransferase n=1 Tax=Streptomyces albus TaxID=1888 RepID=UPI0034070397